MDFTDLMDLTDLMDFMDPSEGPDRVEMITLMFH